MAPATASARHTAIVRAGRAVETRTSHERADALGGAVRTAGQGGPGCTRPQPARSFTRSRHTAARAGPPRSARLTSPMLTLATMDIGGYRVNVFPSAGHGAIRPRPVASAGRHHGRQGYPDRGRSFDRRRHVPAPGRGAFPGRCSLGIGYTGRRPPPHLWDPGRTVGVAAEDAEKPRRDHRGAGRWAQRWDNRAGHGAPTDDEEG